MLHQILSQDVGGALVPRTFVYQTIILNFLRLLIEGTIISLVVKLVLIFKIHQVVINKVTLIWSQTEETRVEVCIITPLPPPFGVNKVPLELHITL